MIAYFKVITKDLLFAKSNSFHAVYTVYLMLGAQKRGKNSFLCENMILGENL